MDIEQYKEILTVIIKKQTGILGQPVAVSVAQKVSEVIVSEDGTVTGIVGDPKQAMSKLVSAYLVLSGQISQNIVTGVMDKYSSAS